VRVRIESTSANLRSTRFDYARRVARTAVVRLGALVLAVLTSRPARAEQTVFGLSFTIAKQESSGVRVVDDAWVEAQIAEANRLFEPLGTRFRWVHEKPLPDANASMHSRGDRDALTSLTEKNGFVDVFLVRELEDVDEPGTYRRGVCWTGRGGKRFIIVSQIAGGSVLAHELGHFFGNPHVQVTDNLMSYSRTPGTPPFLEDEQKVRIQNFSARFLASGRLIDVGPPRWFF
jgi:hypothetical protein